MVAFAATKPHLMDCMVVWSPEGGCFVCRSVHTNAMGVGDSPSKAVADMVDVLEAWCGRNTQTARRLRW